MAEITTLNDPQHAKDFRRGYARGVQSTIEAIRHKLSDADAERLQQWAENELTRWSTALDHSDYLPPEFPTL
jgi:hypothetical protein